MRGRILGRVVRGKWRIDEQIARGGVGTVYRATNVTDRSSAAIKLLHPELARDADIRARFRQEGYAANQVNHEGVVRILEDGELEDGGAFLVMELLEGELLESRRTRLGGRLPATEVYQLAHDLLDVVGKAHEMGIVHRDIKPENLFITKDLRLKVLDFGFARMKSGSMKERTATGFLVGTPGFMAPEQALGDQAAIDAQTDLWSVGASLYVLLTGHAVHEADTIAALLVQSVNAEVAPIATHLPSLPPAFGDAIDRALSVAKADRFPNALAMRRALGPPPTDDDYDTLAVITPPGAVTGPSSTGVTMPVIAVARPSTPLSSSAPISLAPPSAEPTPRHPPAISLPPTPRPIVEAPTGPMQMPRPEAPLAMPAPGPPPPIPAPFSLYVLLAATTMIIVILTGLLVIIGSD